jgi:8-oxo-dGTP diphosphatase
MGDRRVKVGVGVLLTDGDKVLLGLRKGKHGGGTWSLPGGHLEYGETFGACAAREVEEETGLKVIPLEAITVHNDIFGDHHYVTVGVKADVAGGRLTNREPDRCERWEWHRLDKLPNPLFLATENILSLHKEGKFSRL